MRGEISRNFRDMVVLGFSVMAEGGEAPSTPEGIGAAAWRPVEDQKGRVIPFCSKEVPAIASAWLWP